MYKKILTTECIGSSVGFAYNGSVGSCKVGCRDELIKISLEGYYQKFESLFDIICTCLFNMVVDPKELKTRACKTMKSFSGLKNNPKKLLNHLHSLLRYKKNSGALNVLWGFQERVLREIISTDETTKQQFLKKFHDLYKLLCDPSKIFITCRGDWNHIPNPFGVFQRWFPKDEKIFSSIAQMPMVKLQIKEKQTVEWSFDKSEAEAVLESVKDIASSICEKEKSVQVKEYVHIVTRGKRVMNGLYSIFTPYPNNPNMDKDFNNNVYKDQIINCVICGSNVTNLGYLHFTVKIPSDCSAEDRAYLHVLSCLGNLTEGLLYSRLRSGGYAYNVCLNYSEQLGNLSLIIHQSSDIFRAFVIALEVLHEIMKNQEDPFLPFGKYNALYEAIESVSSKNDIYAISTFYDVMNANLNYSSELKKNIQNLNKEKFFEVCQKYLGRMVNFKNDEANAKLGSTLCIVCHSSKAKEVANKFVQELNFNEVKVLNGTVVHKLMDHYEIIEKQKKK